MTPRYSITTRGQVRGLIEFMDKFYIRTDLFTREFKVPEELVYEYIYSKHSGVTLLKVEKHTWLNYFELPLEFISQKGCPKIEDLRMWFRAASRNGSKNMDHIAVIKEQTEIEIRNSGKYNPLVQIEANYSIKTPIRRV